jgi:transposase
MLTFPSRTQLYLATEPTDLRKSFRGLSMQVEHHFGRDVTNGDLFIFLNRRRNQVRILFWDRDGFCIVGKKLEQGTFVRVVDEEGSTHAQVDAGQLAMLLEGIEAKEVKRKKRYRAASQTTQSST